MKKMIQCAVAILFFLTLTFPLASARAQGTAFTYQGSLNSGGSPANGLYDFRFRLDADAAGNTILSTVLTNSIGVTNGLFTTTMDFGAGWFNGSNYWLEIDVKTNNFATYTALTPLQQLTPAPYAIMANSASNLLGALPAGQLSGTILNSSLPTSPTFSGAVTAGSFSGGGANLTSLNANNLSSGTVPIARLSGFQGPDYSTIGGGIGNTFGLAVDATVSGGGNNGGNGNSSTVGGGTFNLIDAGGDHSTIGGGYNNHVVGYESTIGGGYINLINGQDDVIAGGDLNVINLGANQSFIGGGINNTNTGSLAVIPGGDQNVATNNSFAAGHRAKAVHQGAFVWADSQDTDFSSTAANQFNLRANGGVRLVTSGAGLTLDGQPAFAGINGSSLTNISAGHVSADGAQNVLVGSGNVTGGNGVENAAIGYQSFFSNNEGDFNTAVGYKALFSNTGSSDYSGGNFNTASGFQSLYFNTIGDANVADGGTALYFNVSGYNNTAIGTAALYQLGAAGAGGSNNIALGYQAGYNLNGNESSNIDIGNPGIVGDNKTIRIGHSGIQVATYLAGVIVGNGGGLTNISPANLKADGAQNVLAGSGNVVGGNGTENTAIGYESFFSNNEGDFNTAVGYKALFSNTGSSDYSGGNFNTASGFQSLYFNTIGDANVADGGNALYFNVSGYNNTAIGTAALYQLGAAGAGGSNNIALGYQAGYNLNGNESSNIDIGNPGIVGDNKTVRIGTSGVHTQTYLAGVINGNGGGLTNLGSVNLIGSLPAISGANLTSLPANAALLNAGSQTFTGRNSFNQGIGVGTASALEGNLNINTNTYLFSHTIYLRGETGTDHNHGLAYNGNSITNFGTGNVQVDGPVLWGFSGGALGVVNGGAHAVLTWTNGGVSVTGGFAFSSDRDMKTGFEALDAQAVLARVAALPLTSWSYKADTGARHFGPMAQDFHAAFALGGGDDKHINVGDEGGVALAAIQGLNQKLDARAAELENAMKSKNDEIERLKLDNSNLEKRLSALEKLADNLPNKK